MRTSPPLLIALLTGLTLSVACKSEGKSAAETPDAAVDPPLPKDCLAPAMADPTGTAELDDGAQGRASVVIADREACQRSYTLTTTAVLRDNLPGNPRSFAEAESGPTLRSGNDLFDALYALALVEVGQLSVDAVRDGAFNHGAAVSCGSGGCFETGEKWNYVWTRDTAYAVHLGLASADPPRAQNSLAFKLSEGRSGGNLQVVQDTGTGGSYPVSSDRVSWALGAWALLHQLEGNARQLFVAQAYEALTNTAEQDRLLVWDASDGLYHGEQSFLDWREQSYPDWTEGRVVHIAMSKTLSTNLLHMRALEITASLAAELGEAEAQARYSQWADSLRMSIRSKFWLEQEGQFSTYLTTTLDPAPVRRYDLLGSAFAVIFGVATEAQADRVLSGYPHYGPGAPVIWPQQQDTPIYHNRGEWPFVSAYWLRAAAAADHNAVADRMVWALMRGAALNLSNMENFEAASGAPWVSEGETSGPVVNSQRQLWSVAGYLSMVQDTIFGLHPTSDGLVVEPFLSPGIHERLFAATDSIVLNDYRYRGKDVTVQLHLPATPGSGASYRRARMSLNGSDHSGPIDADALAQENLLEVWLEDDAASTPKALTERSDADWKDVFGPRTPAIAQVSEQSGDLTIAIDLAGNDPSDVLLHVYRDGVLVAGNLPGSTTSWTDSEVAAANTSYCYSLELSFASGNYSQHSSPQCWWQPAASAIQVVGAADFVNSGGQASNNHDRFHYENWGDASHSLVASGIGASTTGTHLVQVEYGNGAGSTSTGITCAVKRVRVTDELDGSLVGEGALVMPHLGDWSRWDSSNFVSAELVAGRSYTVTIESDPQYTNMSVFSHFASYTGGQGGSGGEFNRVNIAALRILQR